MSGTFHAVGADDLDGLSLARHVSRLGVTISSPCLFLWSGEGELRKAWSGWLQATFAPLLAPSFVAVHRLAEGLRPIEIMAVDRKIDESLQGDARLRSLACGRSFLDGKSEMQANREWSRFAERVAEGQSPGHAVTLFALQTALYHLPLSPALAAYAWFELESGLPRDGSRARAGSGAEVLSVFAEALPEVRVAIASEYGESLSDAPRLRAV